jgi:NADH:ubiquinone oxidoreductase subunit D
MSEDLEKYKGNNVPEKWESDDTIEGQIATLNLGPTHPATHGIFQNILKVDGEIILSSEQTVGFTVLLKNWQKEDRITKLPRLQTV